MQVRYIGPVDAVEIVTEAGQRISCARGAAVEVPADLGARLVEQDAWQAVAPPKAKARRDAPRDEDGAS